MGSLKMEAGGGVSGGGVSNLEFRIKSEPLPEPSLSTIPQVFEQVESIIQSRIKSEPLSELQLSSVPQIPEPTIKSEPSVQNDKDNDILLTTAEFNIQDAIAKLGGDSKFKPADIDQDPTNVQRKLSELKNTVKIAAVSSRRGRGLSLEQKEKVKLFFYVLSSLDIVTPTLSKAIYLKELLELFIKPEFKFSQEYSNISQALINRIEAQNGFESPPPPSPLTINTQSADVNSKKRRSPVETSAPSKRSRDKSSFSSSSDVAAHSSNIPAPPPDHPIYGDDGIMRGFLWDGKAPRLNPEIFKKSFKHYGHNGLTVGDCWPRQIAVLRDGAHGAPVAGISGDPNNGAYSIVISQQYGEFDVDEGGLVRYSAPGAKESRSKEPDSEKPGVKALKRSIETKEPVRVLRNHTCSWKDRPARGIRYDGLYRVTEANVETNAEEGKFWRFTLKRLNNQDPINTRMPTKEMINLFEKVSEGY